MELRDFIQGVLGVLMVRPNQLFLGSAFGGSTILTTLSQYYPPVGQLTSIILAGHTFLLILGLGLLIGGRIAASIVIALLVVIGVASSLFAVERIIEAAGAPFAAFSQTLDGTVAPVLAQPGLADLYLLLPLPMLAAGVLRWRYVTRREAVKFMGAALGVLRAYCSFCGSYMEPASRDCRSCGKGVPASIEHFCTQCGKPVPTAAKYCWFCGQLFSFGAGSRCFSCGIQLASAARYCFQCGARSTVERPSTLVEATHPH